MLSFALRELTLVPVTEVGKPDSGEVGWRMAREWWEGLSLRW